MITERLARWLAVALVMGLVAACGSNRDAGESIAGGADALAGAQTLGISDCVTCHTVDSSYWTRTWLYNSTHSNPNKRPGSSGPAGATSSCQPCHNELLDGQEMPDVFVLQAADVVGTDSSLNPVYANTARNVVSCESCHGGGQFHNGIGPIPYPNPQPEQCVKCHDYTGVHHDEYPLATLVIESKHNAEELHASSAKCQRCHTLEGSLEFSGYTGNKTVMDSMDAAADNVTPLEEEGLHPLTCAACHEPHTDALRADTAIELNATASGIYNAVTWDPNLSGTPDQFDFCTSCHNLYDNDAATIVASGTDTVYNSAAFYHNTAWYRLIASTHYDNPATGPLSGDPTNDTQRQVEGYVIRANSSDPCFDCHGHEFKTNTRPYNPPSPTTIHTQWASSGHAAGLFKEKLAVAASLGDGVNPSTAPRSTATVDAILQAAASDDTSGGGWTHYNWDRSGRAGCQRCHTATGAMNFMDANATLTDDDATNDAPYDQSANDYSHLYNWSDNPTNGSPQNELLYCWACHTNAGRGELRNPGAITENYAAASTGGPVVTVVYNDISGSNICMSCHLGRETGENIATDIDADGVRSFINSHYLTAGAQLFAVSGYEYGGENYNNVSFYEHDVIGTAGYPGDHGPCVSCHMHSGESHLFLPVEIDETTDKITAITSTVCVECHTGGFSLSPSILTGEEHEYVAALDALNAALASKGMFFANSYPYFHNDTNANQILDPAEISSANGFTNWAGVYGLAFWKDTMGAAFNANLLIHDPGGYAHNRYYAKALIWDSIDFIDDGLLNDTVPTTITALVTTPDVLDTTIDSTTAVAALKYLGASRPGDASRP